MEREISPVVRGVFWGGGVSPDMARPCREIGPRLRSRKPGDQESSRAFLDWLLDDNHILIGTIRYRLGPDRLLDRIHETATRVFNDTTLLPVVFPRRVEEVETHLHPAPRHYRTI